MKHVIRVGVTQVGDKKIFHILSQLLIPISCGGRRRNNVGRVSAKHDGVSNLPWWDFRLPLVAFLPVFGGRLLQNLVPAACAYQPSEGCLATQGR